MRPGQNSVYWTDQWTSVHVLAGSGAAYIGVPFVTAMTGAVLYEVFEQWLQRRTAGQSLFAISGPEIWPNAFMDVVAFMAGYLVVGAARQRGGRPPFPKLARRLRRLDPARLL